MAPPSPRVVVKVDLKQKPSQQNEPLHNRWHPEIPSVAEVKTGEFFRVEMVDAMGGIVKDNGSAEDVKNADLSTSHHLSGPIRVVDEDGVAAKPGDLLVVEICNLGPLPGDEWGYTASLDRENGGGFLTDHFPCATKAIWYFEGIYAYSPQIPGVRFPGLTHPGVIGTAPSMELLLLSCCPCEGRVSGIVDSPNAVATLAIPIAIFDQDIRPKTQKVPVGPRVVRKPDVLKCTYDGKLPITKNHSSST